METAAIYHKFNYGMIFVRLKWPMETACVSDISGMA